jgi:hypothetical protein
MSKLGKRLIQAAREGAAIARGELDPATYRVHHDDDADAGRSRVSFMHQSGAGMFGGRKARAWKRIAPATTKDCDASG